jgi:hypothetical protein
VKPQGLRLPAKLAGLLLILLATGSVFAASPLSPLLDDEQPVQQFVTAEPDPPPTTVKSDSNQTATTSTAPTAAAPVATPAPVAAAPVATPAPVAAAPVAAPAPLVEAPTPSASMPIPLQPASAVASPPPPPPPVVAPPSQLTTPATARALGLSVANGAPPVTDNGLSGGLDENNLLRCQRLVNDMCKKAKDSSQFQNCLVQLKTQPVCSQFLSFAKATQLGLHDDIDIIKQYPQANLALIHVTYAGTDYPGVYYTLGTNGNLVDMIFGPQMQTVDIGKDPSYSAIVSRFPKVQLFSIVDQLPQITTPGNGRGLRLTLRFQLLNGCATCARAGYAYVAYDFAETGDLQQVKVTSLEPVS